MERWKGVDIFSYKNGLVKARTEAFQEDYSNFRDKFRNISFAPSNDSESTIIPIESYILKVTTSGRYGQPICYKCNRREAQIGFLVNEDEPDKSNLVTTVAYYETRDEQGITSTLITKKVEGETLEAIMKREDLNIVYYYSALLIVVKNLQDKYEFTHYDLHPGNVIITKTDKPVTYIHGDMVVKDFFKLTIIDLASSHVKGITPQWTSYGFNNTNVTPGLFDPLFDIGLIASHIYKLLNTTKDVGLGSLLTKYGISTDGDTERDFLGHQRNPIILFNEMINVGRVWGATEPGIKTFRQAERDLNERIVEYVEDDIDIDKMIDHFEFDVYNEEIPYIEDKKTIKYFKESFFVSRHKKSMLRNVALDVVTESIVQVNIDEKDPKYIKILNHGLKELGEAAVKRKIAFLNSFEDIQYVIDEIIITAVMHMGVKT